MCFTAYANGENIKVSLIFSAEDVSNPREIVGLYSLVEQKSGLCAKKLCFLFKIKVTGMGQ